MMKFLGISVALLLFLFQLWGAEKISVEYFFNVNCGECNKVSRLFLPMLQDEAGEMYSLVYCDLADENNFLRLIHYLDQSGNDTNENVYLVVNKRIILGGREDIERRAVDMIKQEYLAPRQSGWSAAADERGKLESRINFATVLVAGFLDGINPCAIATLIFLLSLLTSKVFSRQKIITVGVVYIVAGFLTYLAIGVGFYKILAFASHLSILRLLLNGVMILILVIFAVMSFADAIGYRRHGVTGIHLKLPDTLGRYIHQLMRRRRQQAFVISGTFALGIVVTIVESVCTGQVYLPTILFLVNNSDDGNLWLGYLLWYNAAFTLPLVVAFVAVYYGFKVQALLQLSKWNVMIAKFLLGVFFVALAGVLCYLEFFR